MTLSNTDFDVAIVGGGFCGLTAALELSSEGKKVIVFEKEDQIGGLAGCFKIGDQFIERYYHHFFRSDKYIFDLINKLDVECELFSKEVKTGTYIEGHCYQLSKPLDLLRFSPLTLPERILFGINTLRAQRIKDWKVLEGKTAAAWLMSLYGPKAYKLMWEPLLIGKFGKYFQEISAVWFWNKIALRGGSRNSKGNEELLYLPGSLQCVLDLLEKRIKANGGLVVKRSGVSAVENENGNFKILTNTTDVTAKSTVLTVPLTIAADIMSPLPCHHYIEKLKAIKYLGNLCAILVLDKSLSDIYWMNINEPSFDFVGVIEHTNFIPINCYDNKHIVYLTSYLDTQSELYQLSEPEVIQRAGQALTRLFPGFNESSIQESHVFRSPFSQHIVECGYSQKKPSQQTPVDGLYLASMAQIYPEDRGVNYAIRQGLDVAGEVMGFLGDMK